MSYLPKKGTLLEDMRAILSFLSHGGQMAAYNFDPKALTALVLDGFVSMNGTFVELTEAGKKIGKVARPMF